MKKGRQSLKDLRPKRCRYKGCERIIRSWNKSGYCLGHRHHYYMDNEEGREKHKLYMREYREKQKLLLQQSS